VLPSTRNDQGHSSMPKASAGDREDTREMFEPGGVQSVEIGIRVLTALADAGGEQSLGKIAEMAGMPPAKAHRYLASLSRAGVVERSDTSNRYVLGGLALRIGLVALSRLDVIEAARTEMNELVERIDGSLMLSVWGTNGPTIIRWMESTRPVTVNVRVGSNMPVLRSATGQVFAAYLPEATVMPFIKGELARMKRENGKAPTLADVSHALDKVRKAGLGHTSGGILPGVLALAAPVYNYNNQLAAVIAALGPKGFFDDSLNGKTANELLASSVKLSMRLGARLQSRQD
jgi:DNA-binding IclR family transcriptional regulator